MKFRVLTITLTLSVLFTGVLAPFNTPGDELFLLAKQIADKTEEGKRKLFTTIRANHEPPSTASSSSTSVFEHPQLIQEQRGEGSSNRQSYEPQTSAPSSLAESETSILDTAIKELSKVKFGHAHFDLNLDLHTDEQTNGLFKAMIMARKVKQQHDIGFVRFDDIKKLEEDVFQSGAVSLFSGKKLRIIPVRYKEEMYFITPTLQNKFTASYSKPTLLAWKNVGGRLTLTDAYSLSSSALLFGLKRNIDQLTLKTRQVTVHSLGSEFILTFTPAYASNPGKIIRRKKRPRAPVPPILA